MKTKTKIKQVIFYGSIVIIIPTLAILGVLQAFNYVGAVGVRAQEYTLYPATIYQLPKITVKRQGEADRAIIVSPTMKEWVEKEIKNAELDWGVVEKIIQCESGWDNWKYGINTDGSTDFGLWQINSIHKETISVECRWDYKCSTYWAIQKRLNVGHWNDWVCNK